MKTITSLFLIISGIFISHLKIEAEEINTSEPLPPQFSGMTNVDSDLMPIAVYYLRSNKVAYVCMGIAFNTAPDKIGAIIPKHLFRPTDLSNEVYWVRSARPSTKSLGFITSIEQLGSKCPRDMALVTISTNRVTLPCFGEGSSREPIIFYGTEDVTIKHKEIHYLTSFITGEKVRVLGYCIVPDEKTIKTILDSSTNGKTVTVSDPSPSVMIEFDTIPGSCGHPFFDEYGRLYIVRGGRDPNHPEDGLLETVNAYLISACRKPVTKCCSVTGPLIVER